MNSDDLTKRRQRRFGDWTKVYVSMFDWPRFQESLAKSSDAFGVVVYLLCVAAKIRSRKIPMGGKQINLGAAKLFLSVRKFKAALEALSLSMTPNSDDELVVIWDKKSKQVELQYLDYFQSEYWQRIGAENAKARELGTVDAAASKSCNGNGGGLRTGGRKVGTPWGIYGPQRDAENSGVASELARIDGEPPLEGDGDGDRDGDPGGQSESASGQTTTTTTGSEIQDEETGEIEEACSDTFRPGGEIQAGALANGNHDRNPFRNRQAKVDLRAIPEDEHRRAAADFFENLSAADAEILRKIAPDVDFARVVSQIEFFCVCNIEDLIAYAEKKQYSKLNFLGFARWWFAEEQAKAKGEESTSSNGALLAKWKAAAIEAHGEKAELQRKVALSAIKAGGGKVAACACGWYGHVSELEGPKGIPALQLRGAPDDLFRHCPKCGADVLEVAAR